MSVANAGSILIVDDERKILSIYAAVLKAYGYMEVVTEADSRRVMNRMKSGRIRLVILDFMMPHLSGLDVLSLLKESFPEVPVVMMTAASDALQAVQCMKLGAFDYLLKPVQNEQLVNVVQRALDWQAVMNAPGEQDEISLVKNPSAFSGILTRNSRMRSLFSYLEEVARSSQPVLISGESGTGKELFARALYQLSNCGGEMISVNLGGLDDATFSDTLFGHKKGAFTGADQTREGLIAKASGGVLFLDEIGDLGELSQIRLLRLIQEREYYPVGSDAPRKCNARIVCASNKDLKTLVGAGTFRSDLFYRLNVHHIALPPLRERKEDIPLLLDRFIAQSAASFGFEPLSYPRELLSLLATYDFPGNVRELQGMVTDAVARHRAGMLAQEPFRRVMYSNRASLPASLDPADHDSRMQILESIWGHFPTLEEAENLLITTALEAARGNQGIAATMLGLKRQTLNMRLKKSRNQ